MELDLDAIAQEMTTLTPSAALDQQPLPNQQAPVQAPQEDLWEYQAAGKVIKEPRDMVLKRASQGYHYAQSMQEVNKIKQEAEALRKEALEREARWKPYDDFATQNPQWNEYIKEQWDRRFNFNQQQQNQVNGDGSLENNAVLPPHLLKEIEESREFRRSLLAEKNRERVERENADLQGEIESIRKENANIDFDTPDELGNSLEMKVLKHAMDSGLKGKNAFRLAFRDYYHQELIKRAQEQAREEVTRSLKENKKAGILGQNQAPMQKPSQPFNHKGLREDQVIDLAVQEYMGLQGA